MKTCSKCKEEKPATTEYFYKKADSSLRAECKVCSKKNCNEYYNNNKEKLIKKADKWNKANPEKTRLKNQKWRKNNSQKIKISSKTWIKNNLDKHRANKRSQQNRRKAKKKGNGWEPYTEEQMLSKYGSICYLCNEEIDFKAPRQCGKPGWERSFWIEHVIPVSKGGPDTLDNVRPSHGLCNLNKSNKEIYETA